MAATRRPQVRFWVRVPDPGSRANRKSGKWQSGASTPARFLALCWELRSCSERETGTLVKLEIDLSRSLAPMNGGSFWAAAAGQGWQQHQAGRLDQLSRQKIFFLSPFHLRWWLTGVLSLRADSAEMIGRPLSRWKLIRWLTESNVRSLVRTWEKARTAKFQEQID